MYVAMTRAMKKFFFTSATDLSPHSDNVIHTWATRPSRFIHEALGLPPPTPYMKRRTPEVDNSLDEDNLAFIHENVLHMTETATAAVATATTTATTDTQQQQQQPSIQPLRLAVKSDLTQLTFAQYSTFLQCPLRYCYEFSLNIPAPISATSASVVGRIVAKVVADYFSAKSQNHVITLEQLLQQLTAAWTEQFAAFAPLEGGPSLSLLFRLCLLTSFLLIIFLSFNQCFCLLFSIFHFLCSPPSHFL